MRKYPLVPIHSFNVQLCLIISWINNRVIEFIYDNNNIKFNIGHLILERKKING